jgi:hypothetical protein
VFYEKKGSQCYWPQKETTGEELQLIVYGRMSDPPRHFSIGAWVL